MDKIYRFKVGWEGDILEIKNPEEFKQDIEPYLYDAEFDH